MPTLRRVCLALAPSSAPTISTNFLCHLVRSCRRALWVYRRRLVGSLLPLSTRCTFSDPVSLDIELPRACLSLVAAGLVRQKAGDLQQRRCLVVPSPRQRRAAAHVGPSVPHMRACGRSEDDSLSRHPHQAERCVLLPELVEPRHLPRLVVEVEAPGREVLRGQLPSFLPRRPAAPKMQEGEFKFPNALTGY